MNCFHYAIEEKSDYIPVECNLENVHRQRNELKFLHINICLIKVTPYYEQTLAAEIKKKKKKKPWKEKIWWKLIFVIRKLLTSAFQSIFIPILFSLQHLSFRVRNFYKLNFWYLLQIQTSLAYLIYDMPYSSVQG